MLSCLKNLVFGFGKSAKRRDKGGEVLSLEGLANELVQRGEGERYWVWALDLRRKARVFRDEGRYALACELADIAFILVGDPRSVAAYRVVDDLMRIADALDLLDSDERRRKEGAYGACYLLMCLDPRRLGDGDREIHFYAEAVEYANQVPAYRGLLSALTYLKGEYPQAAMLKKVRDVIKRDASIPELERDIAVFLLDALRQQVA